MYNRFYCSALFIKQGFLNPLKEVLMAIHGVDLREFRQTCRIRVKVEGEEKIVKVFIGRNTHNTAPIGEKIRLVPGGWYNTDDVELLEVLDWED